MSQTRTSRFIRDHITERAKRRIAEQEARYAAASTAKQKDGTSMSSQVNPLRSHAVTMHFSIELQAKSPATNPGGHFFEGNRCDELFLPLGRKISFRDEPPELLNESLPGGHRQMELESVSYPVEMDLRIFRSTSDPCLEDEMVPFGVRNAAVLSGAWMVGQEHEERDGPMLSLELRIPLMPRRAVAPPAQRLQRALPSAQTRGE